MRREHAWALRGERARGQRPMGHWRTVSLIGAIRLGSRPLLMTHRGAVNGLVFRRFVRERLLPWLRRGDVVVMDNLNTHKMAEVRAMIYVAGATPIYLPTYSPQLNPIELLWTHIKRALRRLRLDSETELRRAVRGLRAGVPLAHINGWFRRSLRETQLN